MKNYKVLTIRQPWAHLIVAGIKPVENRVWRTDYRGPILIHAAQIYDGTPDLEREFDIDPARLDYGAVIGIAQLTDIVTEHPSQFFVGPYGWVLEDAQPVKPVPLRGQQRLFNAQLKITKDGR
jgi:hypothetical protein